MEMSPQMMPAPTLAPSPNVATEFNEPISMQTRRATKPVMTAISSTPTAAIQTASATARRLVVKAKLASPQAMIWSVAPSSVVTVVWIQTTVTTDDGATDQIIA